MFHQKLQTDSVTHRGDHNHTLLHLARVETTSSNTFNIHDPVDKVHAPQGQILDPLRHYSPHGN